MTESLTVPCQTFFYREVVGARPDCNDLDHGQASPEGDEATTLYQLEAVLTSQQDVFYSPILRNCALNASDVTQLQLLDELLIPDCNAHSVRFLFATRANGAFLCALTRGGTLRVLEHTDTTPGHTNAQVPPVDAKFCDVCSAAVYTLIHQFHEIRERVFLHEGIALIPSYILGVPVFLTQDRLQAMLYDWSTRLLPMARAHSLYVVRSVGCDASELTRHLVHAAPKPSVSSS